MDSINFPTMDNVPPCRDGWRVFFWYCHNLIKSPLADGPGVTFVLRYDWEKIEFPFQQLDSHKNNSLPSTQYSIMGCEGRRTVFWEQCSVIQIEHSSIWLQVTYYKLLWSKTKIYFEGKNNMWTISDKQHNLTELSMLRCSFCSAALYLQWRIWEIVNNLRNCE